MLGLGARYRLSARVLHACEHPGNRATYNFCWSSSSLLALKRLISSSGSGAGGSGSLGLLKWPTCGALPPSHQSSSFTVASGRDLPRGKGKSRGGACRVVKNSDGCERVCACGQSTRRALTARRGAAPSVRVVSWFRAVGHWTGPMPTPDAAASTGGRVHSSPADARVADGRGGITHPQIRSVSLPPHHLPQLRIGVFLRLGHLREGLCVPVVDDTGVHDEASGNQHGTDRLRGRIVARTRTRLVSYGWGVRGAGSSHARHCHDGDPAEEDIERARLAWQRGDRHGCCKRPNEIEEREKSAPSESAAMIATVCHNTPNCSLV